MLTYKNNYQGSHACLKVYHEAVFVIMLKMCNTCDSCFGRAIDVTSLTSYFAFHKPSYSTSWTRKTIKSRSDIISMYSK